MADILERISRTYPDLAGKKVCKTCDFCVKPNMWDTSTWQCKAPGNITVESVDEIPTKIMNLIAGDWNYNNLYCYQARQYNAHNKCGPEGNWYQIDPYISINGIRYVDIQRAKDHSSERKTTISDLKKLTLDDIL